jgi:hypothetical protein
MKSTAYMTVTFPLYVPMPPIPSKRIVSERITMGGICALSLKKANAKPIVNPFD